MLTSLKIISGDLCDRNGLKSKVSTLEELCDFFSENTQKLHLRCDFWSCRHFVDRLGYMVIITPKRLPFKDKNESCILQIQKGYDLFVQNVTFLTKK